MALASLGCQEPQDGISGYRSTFKIQGKLYHRIGSLLPDNGNDPKFGQLYFYDTDYELENRVKRMQNLDEVIISQLLKCLHECNSYVRSFKAAVELNSDATFDLLLTANRNRKPKDAHCRQYNLPTDSEVAAIVPDFELENNLDVIIHCRGGGLKRINPAHRSYDPLFYVILFPYGDDGYEVGLKQQNNRTLSPSDYYSFRLQVRSPESTLIMSSRRLMQQYAVDSWAKIEGSRLTWAKQHQSTFRAEKYQGLLDAIEAGDENNAGRKIILPPSIYGSPRFYNEQFQNSMCIVRHYGKPDYFITFTTNPNWSEIRSLLNPGEEPRDRPDLCARVFKAKFDALMDDILKKDVLGSVLAHSATIEWQKRGLTHVHILLIMEHESKPRSHLDINKVISAELPDHNVNPKLFEVVVESMVHGPCGSLNPLSPCMNESVTGRTCTKGYPKAFRDETLFREDGIPEYRRRSPQKGGRQALKFVRSHAITIDNS